MTNLEARFISYELTPDEHRRAADVRAAYLALVRTVDCLLPSCREQALAMTHLEDSMMWAVKAIAMNSEGARRG